MPRKKKIMEGKSETVAYSARVSLASNINYLKFKQQLMVGCYVKLYRIDAQPERHVLKRRKILDMPVLTDVTPATENKEKLYSRKNRLDTAQVPCVGIDDMDQKSQLLTCLLLTRNTNEFIHCLGKFRNEFAAPQIHACVQTLLSLPMDYVDLVLKAALQKFENSKFKTMLSSIIINFIIYEVRNCELSSNISSLLAIIRVNDLNLWNENVIYLTDEMEMWAACLLIVHLFAFDGDLSTSVDIICEQAVARQALLIEQGSIIYSNELVELLRFIKIKNEYDLAWKLVMFHLNLDNFPPQSGLWVGLALGTMLANDYIDNQHLEQLLNMTLAKNIVLPDSLLRVSIIRMKDVNWSLALKLFAAVKAFSPITQCLTGKDPIKSLLTIKFCDTWGLAEFLMAFAWVCHKIKLVKENARCNILIHLLKNTRVPEEQPVIIDINDFQQLLGSGQTLSIQKLKSALRELYPPITMLTDDKDFLFIPHSSLKYCI